ncbi:MAG: hypothetical protein NUV82_01905, partial [Candidatus Komeilibacteria bacterium]|nr:hypothetical protein [Candidatus Komeilibacteria bacterium]
MKVLYIFLFCSMVIFAQNWQPVYELYHPTWYDHFYTSNPAEIPIAVQMGYTNNGIVYYWSSENFAGSASVFRLWHDFDHFYTTSVLERDNAVNNGYTYEGVIGFLQAQAGNDLAPWYRYYKTVQDDHAYPATAGKIAWLEAQGYASEGVHGYVSLDGSGGGGGGGTNQPPNAAWNPVPPTEFNFEEITIHWVGEDDSTPVEQLWYHVQLEGPGGFDFWTMSNSLTCWPAVGQ